MFFPLAVNECIVRRQYQVVLMILFSVDVVTVGKQLRVPIFSIGEVRERAIAVQS